MELLKGKYDYELIEDKRTNILNEPSKENLINKCYKCQKLNKKKLEASNMCVSCSEEESICYDKYKILCARCNKECPGTKSIYVSVGGSMLENTKICTNCDYWERLTTFECYYCKKQCDKKWMYTYVCDTYNDKYGGYKRCYCIDCHAKYNLARQSKIYY